MIFDVVGNTTLEGVDTACNLGGKTVICTLGGVSLICTGGGGYVDVLAMHPEIWLPDV
jgi:hypothetical protein